MGSVSISFVRISFAVVMASGLSAFAISHLVE